jgi:hypothetical protein
MFRASYTDSQSLVSVGKGLRDFEGPIRRPKRGSEWEPIKNSLKKNWLSPKNHNQGLPTCEGHIVTTNLPTLGTCPNLKQSGSTTQEARDFGKSAGLGWTICERTSDRPY